MATAFDLFIAALLAGALFPLIAARRAVRQTTLLGAHCWAILAWAAWLAAAVAATITSDPAVCSHMRYIAAALTICTLICVLGARRPGAGAWHFVVAALLAVLLVPLLQAWLGGGWQREVRLDDVWTLLFAALAVVGVINYIPTRSAPAALLLAAALLSIPLRLGAWAGARDARLVSIAWRIAPAMAALSAWAAWALVLCRRSTFGSWVLWANLSARAARRAESRRGWDRVWRDFRDLYGLLWARRLQDRFNAAAVQLDWPLRLEKSGFVKRGAEKSADDSETLIQSPGPMQTAIRALLRRFVTEDWLRARLVERNSFRSCRHGEGKDHATE